MELKNHSLIKQINRSKILNTIRLEAPIARAQIAKKTNLDRKSMTNFISEFLKEGLIEEAGKQEQATGRPFTMLRFIDNAVIGIHISPDFIIGVLIDFNGKIMASHEIEYPLFAKREKIIGAVKKIYERLVSSEKKIHGAGICIPGVLNMEKCTVEASVNMPDIEGMNFREEFSSFIDMPLFFEDASRSKALAEKWFGLGKDYSEFACVDLNVGVGMGIVNNRCLYKGSGDYAGEIGHIIIEPGGRKCGCGNHGCLETYISRTAILNEINAALGKSFLKLEEIQETNPEVEKIIKKAGHRLGIALGSVINILSPKVVILNGVLANKHKEIFMDAAISSAKEYTIPKSFARTKILASQLENANVLGAASLALSEIFEVEGYFHI